MEFPNFRPRRLRREKIIRDMVADVRLSLNDLIVPVFIDENIDGEKPIESLPNYYRYSLDTLDKHVEKLLSSGLNKILLFGIPRVKDEYGSSGYDGEGIIQRAIRRLREVFSNDIIIFTDVCLCQYTSHGHCGVIKEVKIGRKIKYVVDNDESLNYLVKMALSHAEAGADFVAPSNMMDGIVGKIRERLDDEGYTHVGIMSYAVKYASYYYGPFREAAESAPKFSDRRTYQMDPRRSHEALNESYMDIIEGADILMVKPALPYLDIIYKVKETYRGIPLAAYNVSGEYLMLKLAVKEGWLDEVGVVFETLYSIKRAGADLIITYHAPQIAEYWDRKDDIF